MTVKSYKLDNLIIHGCNDLNNCDNNTKEVVCYRTPWRFDPDFRFNLVAQLLMHRHNFPLKPAVALNTGHSSSWERSRFL